MNVIELHFFFVRNSKGGPVSYHTNKENFRETEGSRKLPTSSPVSRGATLTRSTNTKLPTKKSIGKSSKNGSESVGKNSNTVEKAGTKRLDQGASSTLSLVSA